MSLIAGLGNPTREYENTRHNIGFMCVDTIAKEHEIRICENKHKALIGKGYINGNKVLLVKPLTYMNNSGEAIREIADYYKLDYEKDVIIIYDDIDLDVGRIRVRPKGSAGGHNGIKSIIAHLNTQNFARIRVGVGGKPEGGDLINHVLGHFNNEDGKVIEETRGRVVKALECILSDGVDTAMNRFN